MSWEGFRFLCENITPARPRGYDRNTLAVFDRLNPPPNLRKKIALQRAGDYFNNALKPLLYPWGYNYV
jgi:hypothetical protein